MKMNFRPQNKSSKRSLIKRSAIFASLVLVLLIFNILSLNPFSGVLNYIAEPFWTVQNRAASFSEGITSLIKSKKSLTEENKVLSDRISQLERRGLIGESLFEENKKLKKLLGRDTKQNLILASVLAGPPLSPYDTFVIDIGQSGGVSVGDRVVVDGTFVVGVISKVFQKTAQVKLFSAPGEKINVALGPSNLLVVAYGRGGGNFEVRLPRGVEVSEGEVLAIPDINMQVLGVVEEIRITPTSSFQIIYFKNLINTAHVKWVQVIRNK